mmetsp:Transcript_50031/g.125680  ORF Transcript_50031/g.125680 Transcript_50031/m.125680 type:complete len:287 (-) Transcript_50031:332-1192(-)
MMVPAPTNSGFTRTESTVTVSKAELMKFFPRIATRSLPFVEPLFGMISRMEGTATELDATVFICVECDTTQMGLDCTWSSTSMTSPAWFMRCSSKRRQNTDWLAWLDVMRILSFLNAIVFEGVAFTGRLPDSLGQTSCVSQRSSTGTTNSSSGDRDVSKMSTCTMGLGLRLRLYTILSGGCSTMWMRARFACKSAPTRAGVTASQPAVSNSATSATSCASSDNRSMRRSRCEACSLGRVLWRASSSFGSSVKRTRSGSSSSLPFRGSDWKRRRCCFSAFGIARTSR